MNDLPVFRRLLLAAFAIAISAWMLRAQIADALVLRGDGWLYRARPNAALVYYRRAAWMDPSDGAAVDRFAFVAMTLHDRRTTREGIRLASVYLRQHPNDDVVRMDRAMAYRFIGSPAEALEDFVLVGERTHDARAFAFAGYAAQLLGKLLRARELWRSALALQPDLPAARHALARSERAK